MGVAVCADGGELCLCVLEDDGAGVCAKIVGVVACANGDGLCLGGPKGDGVSFCVGVGVLLRVRIEMGCEIVGRMVTVPFCLKVQVVHVFLGYVVGVFRYSGSPPPLWFWCGFVSALVIRLSPVVWLLRFCCCGCPVRPCLSRVPWSRGQFRPVE